MMRSALDREQTFLKALAVSFRLLSPMERRRGSVIALLSFLSGAADIVALVAVYPLISVLVQPGILQTNERMHEAWLLAGSPSVRDFAILLAVAASAVVIIGSAMNTLSQVQVNRFTAACQERMGRELMGALLNAPYSWHIGRNPLLLGSLFSEHIVTWREVIRRVATMAGQMAAIMLPVVTLVGWSPLKGIVGLLAAMMILSLLLGSVKRKTNHLMRQKKEAGERLHVFLSEALQGIKDVKLSSREDDFLKAFARLYHVTSRAFSAANSWNLLPTQLVMIAGQLGIIVVGLGLFLYGVDGGALASTMAIVVLVASRVIPAMNRMGTAINSLANVSSWIETLDEISQSLKNVLPPLGMVKEPVQHLPWNEIALQDVSYNYPNAAKSAIHSVSLRLSRGCSYAFSGTSGAGKSTLVDLILGLLQPTYGSVQVDGRPLSETNRRNWQAGIGYVPQLPLISDATLRENVAFGVPRESIDDGKVRHCLSLAYLSDVLDDLPDGLETPLGDRGLRLSGGQRQRVAIARALYNDPDILVLDEATSALDTLSEHAIRDALLNLRGKITIISIAHRFSTIRASDCIFLMERGGLVAQGTYDQLIRENDLFRQLAVGSKSLEVEA